MSLCKMENTGLMQAIRSKNVQRIQRLVGQGADLNKLYSPGLLPLVQAAQDNDLEMCHCLVRFGASLTRNEDGTLPSPLNNALSFGLNGALKTLIELGCDVNATGCQATWNKCCRPMFKESYTLLHLAVIKHNFEALKMLLEAGSDINKPDAFGNTPIHFACDGSGNFSISNILSYFRSRPRLNPKPDLDAQNCGGETPLMCAASSRDIDAVNHLIKQKVNVHLENQLGYTAVHCAVLHGTEEILLALLRAGCKPYMAHWPNTPLFLAASRNDETYCDILVEFGASPLEVSRKGETLLHIAVRHNHSELVDFALRHSIPVDAKDHNGLTALMAAAVNNFVTAARQLVQHKAVLDAKDALEHSALYHSILHRSTKCAVYLISEGSPRGNNFLELALTDPVVLEFLLLTEPSSWRSSFLSLRDRLDSETDLFRRWQNGATNAHPLKHLCRLVIREALINHALGRAIGQSVKELELPRSLEDYLYYKGEVDVSLFSDSENGDSEDSENSSSSL